MILFCRTARPDRCERLDTCDKQGTVGTRAGHELTSMYDLQHIVLPQHTIFISEILTLTTDHTYRSRTDYNQYHKIYILALIFLTMKLKDATVTFMSNLVPAESS